MNKQGAHTRKYTWIDMIRFIQFRDKNPNLKNSELIKKYHEDNPELTPEQKLSNLKKIVRESKK